MNLTHTTQKFERRFFVSKEVLDTVNSIAWFLADASWMFGLIDMGLLLMVPTVITGLCLLYIEKRKSILMINIAINCWIFMNLLWMVSDMDLSGPYLRLAQFFFALGVVFIIVAALVSTNLRDTFSHFKRFRGIKD